MEWLKFSDTGQINIMKRMKISKCVYALMENDLRNLTWVEFLLKNTFLLGPYWFEQVYDPQV